jgi:hypothetical protein
LPQVRKKFLHGVFILVQRTTSVYAASWMWLLETLFIGFIICHCQIHIHS